MLKSTALWELESHFIEDDCNRRALDLVKNPQSWPEQKLIIHGSWGKSLLTEILVNEHQFTVCDPLTPTSHDRIVWDDWQCDGEKVFHNWNDITARKAYLCITTRSISDKIHPPDLKSRVNSTLSVYIAPPGIELRKKITRTWLASRGITIGDREIDYLFTHYPTNVKDLKKHINMIYVSALEFQRNITIDLIKLCLPKPV